MPQLGIVFGNTDGHVVVGASQLVIGLWGPIEEDIAAIKVNGRVLGIDLARPIKVLLGLHKIIVMVVSEASIVNVDGRGAQLDGLVVVGEGLGPILKLELRQRQIVVGGRLVVLDLDCLLQVADGFLQATGTTILNATIKAALVQVLILGQRLERLAVVLDSFIDSVQA